MKHQLKNLLVRFYASDGHNASAGKQISKSEKEILQNLVGQKQTSIGQQSRIKTNR